jgi:hypothetical protein
MLIVHLYISNILFMLCFVCNAHVRKLFDISSGIVSVGKVKSSTISRFKEAPFLTQKMYEHSRISEEEMLLMSYDDQQDPNQQGQQQDQYGNQQGQYGNQDPNQQGQYGNQDPNQQGQQQGQYSNQDPNQQGQQQGQYGNQNPNQQGQQDQFGGIRQQAEQQIDQAIDQFGNKIPGGQQFTQQAKDKVPGLLGDLESEAEKRMGGLGGNQGNQQ